MTLAVLIMCWVEIELSAYVIELFVLAFVVFPMFQKQYYFSAQIFFPLLTSVSSSFFSVRLSVSVPRSCHTVSVVGEDEDGD